MQITVRFEAQLRHIAGVGHAVVSVPDACGVTDAIRAIAAQFGTTLAERLFTADGTTSAILRSALAGRQEERIRHGV